MNINGALLVKMIETDMQHRDIKGFLLQEETAENPAQIPVHANEVVYVCLFQAADPAGLHVVLRSATNAVRYNEHNTSEGFNNIISKHLSSIKVDNHSQTPNIIVRYIRVKFNAPNR